MNEKLLSEFHMNDYRNAKSRALHQNLARTRKKGMIECSFINNLTLP
jgi:hypothetical protein